MGQGSQEFYAEVREQQKELRQELFSEAKAGARRSTLGCLGTIIGMFVAAILLTLTFSPWAFFIGNRFTPTATWEGFGRLHSSTGAEYGLYVKIAEATRSGRHASSGPNLRGTAALCTPLGSTYEYGLDGKIENVWLYTEGKKVRFSLETPSGDKSRRNFQLYGTWQNGRLVLNDQGSLGRPFHADGSLDPKGSYNPAPIKGEHAETVVAYGGRFDFDEMCANQMTGKRK